MRSSDVSSAHRHTAYTLSLYASPRIRHQYERKHDHAPEVRFADTLFCVHALLLSTVTMFQKLWRAVGTAKATAAMNATGPNVTSVEYRHWFATLQEGPELTARGLVAGECADVNACIGTLKSGHCICYQQ